MLNDNPQSIITLLRSDLLKARKDQDRLTTDALQSVIAAIDNAGAVPVSVTTHSIGVGSTELPRRELSAEDLSEIIKKRLLKCSKQLLNLAVRTVLIQMS